MYVGVCVHVCMIHNLLVLAPVMLFFSLNTQTLNVLAQKKKLNYMKTLFFPSAFMRALKLYINHSPE